MAGEAPQYNELAPYYDYIYSWKDYRKEAATIERLIQKHKKSAGKALLDVGCGTGKHIQHLRHRFDCVGVDASAPMLAVAKENVPEVEFVESNMLDFNLGRRFDVVLCLFSGMGYLKTRDEARKAIFNFAEHMKDGAVLIIEPWFRRSDWTKGSVHMQTYDAEGLKIARVGFSDADGEFAVADESYLIAEEGKGTKYVRDMQRLRFFEPEWTFETMRRAGLNPRFSRETLMPGRMLTIATKR
ncbi:MAG: class I SAM-dependent methyltransferase [Nitrososphaerota archaeon]|nr:class I SAM-dependent methyltransferase [Nitrososphaerota archaeon]